MAEAPGSMLIVIVLFSHCKASDSNIAIITNFVRLYISRLASPEWAPVPSLPPDLIP